MLFKRKTREEEEKLDKAYEALCKIRIFPGTLNEYETMYGYSVEIIDTGLKNKGIKIMRRGMEDFKTIKVPDQVMEELVENGIEAIIHASYSRSDNAFGQIHNVVYGLPIRRKKE